MTLGLAGFLLEGSSFISDTGRIPSQDIRGVRGALQMKLRLLLLVTLAPFIAAGVWIYELYMGQLNNMIALQRCVLEIEQQKRETGHLPPSVLCNDYWGQQVAYSVRDGTYVLVSAGSDREMDANYGALKPSDIPEADTCLTRGADTVFVGRSAVRSCTK